MFVCLLNPTYQDLDKDVYDILMVFFKFAKQRVIAEAEIRFKGEYLLWKRQDN